MRSLWLVIVGVLDLSAFGATSAPATQLIPLLSLPNAHLYRFIQDDSSRKSCISRCYVSYQICHNDCMLKISRDQQSCMGNCQLEYNICTRGC
jgi:hypothetical protein